MAARELTVLLIEDETQMRRFLRASLPPHGYALVEASTGREGIAAAGTRNPDVILLDLGLPDADGIETTKQLREFTRTPIIVISARGREHDKVAALDAGADDYLTKPFGVGELLARMRVARRHAEKPSDTDESVYVAGRLTLDFGKRHVSLGGRDVHLTPIEFKLLLALIRNAGRVLTHQHLLREAWGTRYSTQTQYLHVYMGQLRGKLEEEPARPKLLITEPGVGYRLRGD